MTYLTTVQGGLLPFNYVKGLNFPYWSSIGGVKLLNGIAHYPLPGLYLGGYSVYFVVELMRSIWLLFTCVWRSCASPLYHIIQ